jgi:hypothetical protein
MNQVPTPQPLKTALQPAPVRARAQALGTSEPWPGDLLEAFCLRMAGQGMCVSRALMQHDRRYGLEQLAHAHNMADDTLRAMAVQLFRHFERHQSGIPARH